MPQNKSLCACVHMKNVQARHEIRSVDTAPNDIDSNDNEILNHNYPRQGPSPEPNILQVYAAYDTGEIHIWC